MNRRTLITGAAAVALTAAGCTPGSITPTQIIADAKAALTALGNVVVTITNTTPTLIPAGTAASIMANVQAGLGLVTGIAGNLPPAQGATVLAQVENYLNAALNALAAFPLIPPPYNLIIQAAAVILPEIEAFVNSVAAGTAKASPRVRAMAGAMTLDQARAILAGAK